jgi:hypothetical protein
VTTKRNTRARRKGVQNDDEGDDRDENPNRESEDEDEDDDDQDNSKEGRVPIMMPKLF